jgi:hypothetical protein
MGESAGSLQDPLLKLTDLSSDTVFEENDNWRDHATADEVVAELRAPAGVLDAAFAIDLNPGVYLAHLNGRGGTTGLGLLSVTEIPLP